MGSINFAVDIQKQDKGKGLFRANPSLRKHSNYITLIHNLIYNEVLESINKKSSTLYKEAKQTFLEQITVQEEIFKVEMLRSDTNWSLEDRLAYLNGLLLETKNKMVPIETLLDEPLNTKSPEILEIAMCSIRTHTMTYQGTVNALRREKKKEIEKKLAELNSILDDGDNEDEIEILEQELNKMTDEMLQEQGSHFKNHVLLNDCRITKEFIRLESRKNGYNNVVKLTSKNDNGEVTESITDPDKIRKRMASTFCSLKI